MLFFLSRLTVTIIIYFIECDGPVDLYTNRKRNILNQGGVIMLVHIRILYRFSRKRHIQERNQIHIQHTPYTSTHQSAGMSYQYTPLRDRVRLYLCFMHSRVKNTNQLYVGVCMRNTTLSITPYLVPTLYFR